MSIRELARAQTFPDDWVFHSQRSNVHDIIRQIGNAVAPVVGQALGEEILKAKYRDQQADVRGGSRNDPIDIDD